METVLWSIAVILTALWAVLCPGRPSAAQRALLTGVNYAHRGLHTRDKSVPENSLAAFAAAVKAGYGIELDVQLSQDGEVMVFHDDTLDRVCGVEGRVDAYPAEALQQMALCGTRETVPLFTQVLDTVRGQAPLIVELKTGPRKKELCEKVLLLLRGYKGPYCIESFDPRIVAWFRKNAPDILRGQLTDAPGAFGGQPFVQRVALGNVLANCIARPQFIAHGPGSKTPFVRLAESMGALRVCWTVRDTDNIDSKQAANDAVIFEFYSPAPRFDVY